MANKFLLTANTIYLSSVCHNKCILCLLFLTWPLQMRCMPESVKVVLSGTPFDFKIGQYLVQDRVNIFVKEDPGGVTTDSFCFLSSEKRRWFGRCGITEGQEFPQGSNFPSTPSLSFVTTILSSLETIFLKGRPGLMIELGTTRLRLSLAWLVHEE